MVVDGVEGEEVEELEALEDVVDATTGFADVVALGAVVDEPLQAEAASALAARSVPMRKRRDRRTCRNGGVGGVVGIRVAGYVPLVPPSAHGRLDVAPVLRPRCRR